MRIFTNGLIIVSALMISAPTFANDEESETRISLSIPSPAGGRNAEGIYTVGHNLDGENVLNLEELLAASDRLAGRSDIGLQFDGLRYIGIRPSETATFFFRRGVKHYEKNNWKKAERAFKASLRAHDGGLETYSYLYLANIAKQKGDLQQAQIYTARYYGLDLPEKTRVKPTVVTGSKLAR